MTTVIGIDPSLVCLGLTTIRTGTVGQPALDTLDVHTQLVTSRGHRTDTWPQRQTRLTTHRTNTMRLVPRDTDLALIEGPAYSRGADPGAWDRAHLWWLLVDALTHLRIPYAVVPSTTLKKHVTDKGNAKKAEVVAAVARMWPATNLPTDDAADSLALATIAAQHLKLDLPFPVLERHKLALTKIDWPQLRSDADTVRTTPGTVEQDRMTGATQ